ncbi:MAG: threonine/serine dehydratase [Bacteroidetes bacterium]|jgi:threonine dehydratase|nr:threonine/serine dehydratase [Bacteroidota bacterium]
MITLDDIRAASERVRPVVHRTPLLHAAALDERSGNSLYLKAENLQRVGAFKIRGAYNKIATLPPEVRAMGIVAHSSGNHAQGTALAARLLGAKATIVMPGNSPAVKVDATRGYGAEVVFCQDSSDDRARVANEIVQKTGATLVPPFDDDLIIAGQGTAMVEVAEDLRDLDAVVVPIGGGGLIGGTAVAAKHLCPGIKVVGVETEPANDAQRSFRTKQIVKIDPPKTIADGMRTQAVGKRNFEIMLRYVDDIVTVTDEEVMETMRFLLLRLKVLAEPTGAVAPAAVFHRKLGLEGKRICAFISGGNVEPSFISTLLNA